MVSRSKPCLTFKPINQVLTLSLKKLRKIMKDSTILTEQHIFKAKILPQLKKITRAVLSTLMRFSMSGYNNYLITITVTPVPSEMYVTG